VPLGCVRGHALPILFGTKAVIADSSQIAIFVCLVVIVCIVLTDEAFNERVGWDRTYIVK